MAIGECGLDYDRLHWSDKETQNKIFPIHFDLAQKYNLPMYLHSRNCEQDFLKIVKDNRNKFSTGVVHSFTGTITECRALIAMDLYIGINGCSVKTEANLAVVKQIPVNRIMFETDCPYCEIKKSHGSHQFVDTQFAQKDPKKYHKIEDETTLAKGRNEPCKIVQVIEVVAKLKNIDYDELARQSFQTSVKIFGPPRIKD